MMRMYTDNTIGLTLLVLASSLDYALFYEIDSV